MKKDGKAWYAWHENPPMEDLLGSKVVLKDIAKEPAFWPERDGDTVPKHSVYYLVSKDSVPLDGLLDYLNARKHDCGRKRTARRQRTGSVACRVGS